MRLFFLIRLVIALAFYGLSMGAFAGVKLALRSIGIYDSIPGRTLSVVALVLAMYSGYALYLRLFEKRGPEDYSARGWYRELALGMGIGVGLVSLLVLILWTAGVYRPEGLNPSDDVIRFLLLSIVIGFSEELLSRGIIFRILEQGLGSWIALLVSTLEVAITHLANPGAGLLSTVAVAVEFGVMLVLFYMITRKLWLITGFHFAWNFTMGGIFAINVSGLRINGLVQSRMEGPPLLTGGAFGLEASVPALALCLVLSLVLARHVVKRKLVVRPAWHVCSAGPAETVRRSSPSAPQGDRPR